MATSFVEWQGHGFWAPDGLLEVWMILCSDALGKSASSEAREYSLRLRSIATAGMTGCIELGFDSLGEALREEVMRASVVAAQLCESDPAMLSAARLNFLGIGGEGAAFQAVPVHHLERLSVMVIGLLRGRWKGTAADAESDPAAWLQ
jgi:hypothetical protein